MKSKPEIGSDQIQDVITLFLSAANFGTVLCGFEKNNIQHVKPDIFTDTNSLPSRTTNIELDVISATPSEKKNTLSTAEHPKNCEYNVTRAKILQCIKEFSVNKNPQAISVNNVTPPLQDVTNTTTSARNMPDPEPRPGFRKRFNFVTKIQSEQKRVTTKRGNTVILTSTPYKVELQERSSGKKAKIERRQLDEMKEVKRMKSKVNKRKCRGKHKVKNKDQVDEDTTYL